MHASACHAALTLQLLQWIAEKPRPYAELMDAWRTTCPRLTIWEDACTDGLVGVGQDGILYVTDEGCGSL